MIFIFNLPEIRKQFLAEYTVFQYDSICPVHFENIPSKAQNFVFQAFGLPIKKRNSKTGPFKISSIPIKKKKFHKGNVSNKVMGF